MRRFVKSATDDVHGTLGMHDDEHTTSFEHPRFGAIHPRAGAAIGRKCPLTSNLNEYAGPRGGI